MGTIRTAGLVAAALCVAALVVIAEDNVTMNIPPGDYAKKLGNNSFADPDGKRHSRQQVIGRVVVAIFTAPIMSQGDVQQKWANLLATDPSTKLPDTVALFIIEDMSQAGWFKGIARDDMKKAFTEDSRPFLLMDERGEAFKRFGVGRGRTQVLIYDKTGTLRDVETDLKDTDLTVKRIKAITALLLAEKDASPH